MKVDALMYFSTLTCKNLIMLLDSLDQNKMTQNIFESKLLQSLSVKFKCEVWVNATECTYHCFGSPVGVRRCNGAGYCPGTEDIHTCPHAGEETLPA